MWKSKLRRNKSVSDSKNSKTRLKRQRSLCETLYETTADDSVNNDSGPSNLAASHLAASHLAASHDGLSHDSVYDSKIHQKSVTPYIESLQNRITRQRTLSQNLELSRTSRSLSHSSGQDRTLLNLSRYSVEGRTQRTLSLDSEQGYRRGIQSQNPHHVYGLRTSRSSEQVSQESGH